MRKSLAIIGGGAAALSLASFIDSEKYTCTIFEKNTQLGRKFLVAGKGGFNLTHNEPIEHFIGRYTPHSFLRSALNEFTNQDFRAWLESIGIETFVGSSQRVYPLHHFKPIDVLKKIEDHILRNNVQLSFNSEFFDFSSDKGVFIAQEWKKFDIVVFALGGASWSKTGSTGDWLTLLHKYAKTIPFKSSNCNFLIDWPTQFIEKHHGKPIKNCVSFIGNKKQKGEIVLTKTGVEGNGIYGLSPEIREQLETGTSASVYLDLKPHNTVESILKKLSTGKGSISARLRKEIKMPSELVDLLKISLTKDDFLHVPTLTHFIKHFPLKISGLAPIEEAISTVGGIDVHSVDENYQLKNLPNYYCIGEMLDWDAPTGGYLLQACFSMGHHLAQHLNNQN